MMNPIEFQTLVIRQMLLRNNIDPGQSDQGLHCSSCKCFMTQRTCNYEVPFYYLFLIYEYRLKSENDQEITQSHTADQPTALLGRDTEQ